MLYEHSQNIRENTFSTLCLKKNIPDIFSCNLSKQSVDAIVSYHTQLVLLYYLRKCSPK